jgi:hypothetical protein
MRRARLAPHCVRRVLVHLDHLRRIDNIQVEPTRFMPAQFGVYLLLRANQHHLAAILARGLHRALHRLLRRVIAADCIKNYSHSIPYLQLHYAHNIHHIGT